MPTTLPTRLWGSFLGAVLLLTACQTPPQVSKLEQLQQQQAADRQALEMQYDQAILSQQNGTNALPATPPLTPQRAQELLETAQLLFNIDSHLVDSIPPPTHTAKMTQHGGVFFTVRDYDQAYAKIQTLAQAETIQLLSETEQTTEHSRGIILQLQTPAHELNETIQTLRGLATVLRKKQRWQPTATDYHLTVKSSLVVQQQRLNDLSEQLAQTENVAEQLLLKKAIAEVSQSVEHTVLQLQAQFQEPRYSVLTVAFYEEPPLPTPVPQNFGADFSGNLKTGWVQFKHFLLQAALVWPYIVLVLLFLIIVALAVSSSRRRARQFKLQLLHKQQPIVQPVVVPKPPQM